MRPILFRWRRLTIGSYEAFLYLGLVAGIVVGNVAAHARGIDAFGVFVASFAMLVPALVGSRLLHVASEWAIYRTAPRRIWSRTDGGAAQYGGVIVALPLSWPVLGAVGVPAGDFWDVTAFAILTTMIFARVGCLLNGCCSGRPSMRFGVSLPNHRGEWQRRVPTQMLEAVWSGMLLAGAVLLWPQLPFPGALFLLAAGAYAAGRLVLESLREHPPGARAFNVQHAISLGIVVSAVTALKVLWPSLKG